MKNFPFQESPETVILVCSHLKTGAMLHWVHHLPDEPCIWHLMCAEDHQPSDMNQITLGEALKLFPEIEGLGEVPKNMDVSFKKGRHSGRWFDFHRSN